MRLVKEVSDLREKPTEIQKAHARQYAFWGYGGRGHSKITWPLVFFHVSPQGADEYFRRALELDLCGEFRPQPKGVSSYSPPPRAQPNNVVFPLAS